MNIINTFCCIAFAVLFTLPTSSFAIKYQEDPTFRIRTIVIDAGHGGHDPGAVGAQYREKDVVLKVALKLGEIIKKEMPEIKVLYTRKDDTFVELHQRARFANNNKADLFISIHANSLPRRRGFATVRGTETFVLGFGSTSDQDAAIRENASILLEENYEDNYQGFDPKDPESYVLMSLMKNQFREQSLNIASYIQREFGSLGKADRGVKEAGFFVLKPLGMPAVLTELGFMTNPEEERYMNSEKGGQELAKSIFNAIKAYKRQVER